MEVTPFCAFPAQAGIQTLTNRLVIPRQSSPFDRLRMRMKGGAFFTRVIASVAKQPRGLTRA